MPDDLSFNLHALVARLDRSADRILRSELGFSYRRFLALFMVGELGATTQRSLAERLEVTEASISRMTGVLSAAGLLLVAPDPAGGNRRALQLTPEGARLVDAGRRLLADRFQNLLELSGIPARAYARHTERLLAALEDDGSMPSAHGGSRADRVGTPVRQPAA